MARFSINKLLDGCIKAGGSDLHLVAGQPPVIRSRGRMRRLGASMLDSQDTSQLMKSIAPENSQLELYEKGSTVFCFAFANDLQFRVSAFQRRNIVSIVFRLISSNANEGESEKSRD